MALAGTQKLFNEKMTNDLFVHLQPVTTRSLSDTLLDQLIDMIMDGTLKPGYVFPNENVMCDQLKIGRSTLRETYKALMALGFITRSKTGTTVNDTQQIITSVPLNYIFKNTSLDDIDEFRQMLETESCYLAAERATPQQIGELEGILRHMKDNRDDIEALTKDDIRFHLAVANASGNALLRKTLMAIVNEIEDSAYSGYYMETGSIDRSIHFHEQICSAIAAHDQHRARTSMRTHIKDIYIVLRLLQDKKASQR